MYTVEAMPPHHRSFLIVLIWLPEGKAKLGRQEGRKVEPLGAVFSAACQMFLMANRAYGWASCLIHDA